MLYLYTGWWYFMLVHWSIEYTGITAVVEVVILGVVLYPLLV